MVKLIIKEKLTFEQRPEGDKQRFMLICLCLTVQAEAIAKAKALMQQCFGVFEE